MLDKAIVPLTCRNVFFGVNLVRPVDMVLVEEESPPCQASKTPENRGGQAGRETTRFTGGLTLMSAGSLPHNGSTSVTVPMLQSVGGRQLAIGSCTP